MSCVSGILSGIGVTWRAIQVLQESASSFDNSKQINSNLIEKVNVTFGKGIWMGWICMTILILAGITLGKSHKEHIVDF
jgi:hypothetical protein